MSLGESTWDFDKEQGAIIEQMLAEVVFPQITKGKEGVNWICQTINFDKRDNKTVEAQYKGFDIVLRKWNKVITYDVKALLKNYLVSIQRGDKRALPTFCIELTGNVFSGKIGWFLDDEKLNDYYAFIWIHDCNWFWMKDKNKNVKALRNWHDIKHAEVLFIKRENLIKALEKSGCTKELMNKARGEMAKYAPEDEIRYDPIKECVISNTKGMPFWVMKTSSLKIAEAPVNLVIKKEFYYQNVEGMFAYDVYPNEKDSSKRVQKRIKPFHQGAA